MHTVTPHTPLAWLQQLGPSQALATLRSKLGTGCHMTNVPTEYSNAGTHRPRIIAQEGRLRNSHSTRAFEAELKPVINPKLFLPEPPI
jgi:hypothetical protein